MKKQYTTPDFEWVYIGSAEIVAADGETLLSGDADWKNLENEEEDYAD